MDTKITICTVGSVGKADNDLFCKLFQQCKYDHSVINTATWLFATDEIYIDSDVQRMENVGFLSNFHSHLCTSCSSSPGHQRGSRQFLERSKENFRKQAILAMDSPWLNQP